MVQWGVQLQEQLGESQEVQLEVEPEAPQVIGQEVEQEVQSVPLVVAVQEV